MSITQKSIITALLLAVLVAAVIMLTNPIAWWFQPTSQSEPAATTTATTTADEVSETREEVGVESQPLVSVVADNLSVPWGIDFLPGGNILITERTGTFRELNADGKVIASSSIASARPRGEGGLLGVAVHPNFSQNNWIYLYETTDVSGQVENRVRRFVYQNGELTSPTIIIDGITGASYHDGGRLAFGPGGYLYITTGDAGNPEAAQSTTTLEGKVLRLQDDGTIPADNPFGNAVYSYGHRNPQGIDWHQSGVLFATEHGRSGIRSGLDEVNLIKSGGNYGWPYLEGDETCEEDAVYNPVWPTESCQAMSPLVHSGPDITWAPASIAVHKDTLFFGGLRGQALYEAPIINSGVEVRVGAVRSHFKNELGRIRTAMIGPNNEYIYLTTSNTDGRGQPRRNDDKLLRISLSVFE